jgi:hypothetical protein
MNVKRITREWLKEQEYDGLYNDSFPCTGCANATLLMCVHNHHGLCKPGYRQLGPGYYFGPKKPKEE